MKRAGTLLKDRRVRIALVVFIVAATFAVFGYYLITHPEVITLLVNLPPSTLLLLTLTYIGTIIANAFVLSVSLKMIGKRVHFLENMSLTGYSSVVNFFGPLQSGPGFRAAYLKTRHGVSVKSFFYATVVFYGFFAAMNGVVMATALLQRSPTIAAVTIILALAVTGIVFATYKKTSKFHEILRSIKLTSPYFWLIGMGAFALSACTTAAYYVELLHVDPTINFLQAIVYSAAANLALFVSLTPGAIGFRESFLVLSQQLHQIPTNVILSASIIDRAFYVAFLLALFIVLLLVGARAKLHSGHSA